MPTIRFNCGGYHPGRKPLSASTHHIPTVPGIIIIAGPVGGFPTNLPDPPIPPVEKWRCITEIIYCPYPLQHQIRYIRKYCVQCSPNFPDPTTGALGYHPDCIYPSNPACVASPCAGTQSFQCIEDPPTTVGGSPATFPAPTSPTTTGGGPAPFPAPTSPTTTGGSPSPFPAPTSPTTTGGSPSPYTVPTTPTTPNVTRYKCDTFTQQCKPPYQHLPLFTRKQCVACTQIYHTELQIWQWPDGCIYPTKPLCEAVPCNSTTRFSCIEISQAPQVSLPNPKLNISQAPAPYQPNSKLNISQAEIPQIRTTVPDATPQIGTSIPDINNLYGGLLRQTSVSREYKNISAGGGNVVANKTTSDPDGSLYNKKYNVFAYKPSQEIRWVTNSKYLNIFGDRVCEEVDYFLKVIGSTINWDEKFIFNLTIEKIGLSLNPGLFKAINNLHYLGGSLIPVSMFLEAIKKHLLKGTIKFFDPSFYINLYHKQSGDTFVNYFGSNSSQTKDREVLQYLADEAISANADVFDEIKQSKLKRQKRLNEDISTFVNVDLISSGVLPIYLKNDGLPVTDAETVSLGDGYGYYLQVSTVSGGVQPLELGTDISAALYVPPNSRFNALKMLGSNPEITITTSSLLSNNEFTSSSVSGFSIQPYFFKLILSSVTDGSNGGNFLVNDVRCNYKLITDSTEISTQVQNYGYSITRLAVDADDPFFRYGVQSSSMDLQQYDITFRNFQKNRALVEDAILTRNIPFGIIMTPVMGSKYNPFNGSSKIDSFTNNVVVRSVATIPHFDTSDKDIIDTELSAANIFNSLGVDKIGISETPNMHGSIYLYNSGAPNLITNFFSGHYYSSSAPELLNHGYSYLINNILDPLLAANTSATEIKWWDVYSRMTINRFCELFYDSGGDIHRKLELGLRQSVKIKNVLGLSDEDDINIIVNDSSILKDYTRG